MTMFLKKYMLSEVCKKPLISLTISKTRIMVKELSCNSIIDFEIIVKFDLIYANWWEMLRLLNNSFDFLIQTASSESKASTTLGNSFNKLIPFNKPA